MQRQHGPGLPPCSTTGGPHRSPRADGGKRVAQVVAHERDKAPHERRAGP